MSQIYDSYFSHAMVNELNKLAAEGTKKTEKRGPTVNGEAAPKPIGIQFPDKGTKDLSKDVLGGGGCKQSSGVGEYYNNYQNLMNYLYR